MRRLFVFLCVDARLRAQLYVGVAIVGISVFLKTAVSMQTVRYPYAIDEVEHDVASSGARLRKRHLVFAGLAFVGSPAP